MKPLKNRIFCYGCNRTKMLFDSKSKADNFIRFNSEDIEYKNGKAPIRSYYCQFCCGYHVTSNPSTNVGEDIDKRDQQRIKKIELYTTELADIKKKTDQLNDSLDKTQALINFGMVKEAEHLLSNCYLELDDFSKFTAIDKAKYITFRNRVKKVACELNTIKDFLNSGDFANFDIESIANDNITQKTKVAIHNICLLKKVEENIQQIEELKKGQQNDIIPNKIKECQQLLEELKGRGKKELIKHYNSLLSNMQ